MPARPRVLLTRLRRGRSHSLRDVRPMYAGRSHAQPRDGLRASRRGRRQQQQRRGEQQRARDGRRRRCGPAARDRVARAAEGSCGTSCVRAEAATLVGPAVTVLWAPTDGAGGSWAAPTRLYVPDGRPGQFAGSCGIRMLLYCRMMTHGAKCDLCTSLGVPVRPKFVVKPSLHVHPHIGWTRSRIFQWIH